MDEQRALTVTEVARRLSVNPHTIYRLVARGELRAYRVGRVLRVPPDALEEYLTAHEERPNLANREQEG